MPKDYKNIVYFENRKRILELKQFRALVLEYFENMKIGGLYDEKTLENEKSAEARQKINLFLPRAEAIFQGAHINTIMQHTAPLALGGQTRSIDLLTNIFNYHYFEIPPQFLIDYIDKALGLYQNNLKASFIRMINPFHWINALFAYIAGAPFRFLVTAGFDKEKIENSFVVKIFKAIFYLIQVFLTVTGVLEFFNLLDEFKELLKIQ